MSEINQTVKVGDEDESPNNAEKSEKVEKAKKGKKDKKKKKEKITEEGKEEVDQEEKEEEPDELTHTSEHVTHVIDSIKNYISEKGSELTIPKLIEEIQNNWISIGATPDLKYYIAFNSWFSMNILKEFSNYALLFKTYLSADLQEGTRNLLMTIVHFFVEKYPKLEIAIPTFLHNWYDLDLIEESVYLQWEAKKFKMNKKSWLYNRKLEKAFKKKAEKFFSWLKEADEGEEEESEDEKEEEKKIELTGDEQRKKDMKDLIEKQKMEQEKDVSEFSNF